MRLVLILFVLISNFATAQQKRHLMVNGERLENSDAFWALLNPNDIEAIGILKGPDSDMLYCGGGMPKDIISIELKSNVKVLAYNKLLRKFKVKKKYRQYPAYVGEEPIYEKTKFYAPYTWIREIIVHRSNGVNKTPYLNMVANK